MNDASRSTPMSLVALPHSTGNTAPDATPSASACASSAIGIASSARYRSMRSSSPTTIPSINASWIECSSISISGGIGPSVALPST